MVSRASHLCSLWGTCSCSWRAGGGRSPRGHKVWRRSPPARPHTRVLSNPRHRRTRIWSWREGRFSPSPPIGQSPVIFCVGPETLALLQGLCPQQRPLFTVSSARASPTPWSRCSVNALMDRPWKSVLLSALPLGLRSLLFVISLPGPQDTALLVPRGHSCLSWPEGQGERRACRVLPLAVPVLAGAVVLCGGTARAATRAQAVGLVLLAWTLLLGLAQVGGT